MPGALAQPPHSPAYCTTVRSQQHGEAGNERHGQQELHRLSSQRRYCPQKCHSKLFFCSRSVK